MTESALLQSNPETESDRTDSPPKIWSLAAMNAVTDATEDTPLLLGNGGKTPVSLPETCSEITLAANPTVWLLATTTPLENTLLAPLSSLPPNAPALATLHTPLNTLTTNTSLPIPSTLIAMLPPSKPKS